MQTLEFHLDHFDGPMDLLMHLLEKNKIDVYDIPINELTDQYLMYLEDAQSMNLEIASHFLLFAAQLVRIKVKMLLPKRRSEAEEEDPRQSLVDQIVAYRFFKELAGELESLRDRSADYYQRKVDLSALREKYRKIEPPVGRGARGLHRGKISGHGHRKDELFHRRPQGQSAALLPGSPLSNLPEHFA